MMTYKDHERPEDRSPLEYFKWVMAVSCIILATVLSTGCGGDGGGGKTVFSSSDEGIPGIYMIDTSTEEETRLTSTTAGRDSAPVWSPDRKNIAFISDRTGSSRLWVMTEEGGGEGVPFPEAEPVVDFRWDPESTRIALLVGDKDGGRIFVGDLATGEVEPMTSEDERTQLGGWSPDGEWIVYSVLEEGRTGLYKRNPRGVQEIQITTGQDTNASWSTKGDLIAFNRPGENVLNIYVTDSDGHDQRALHHTTGNDTNFEWSPDGRRLVFVSDKDGNREIYTVDANGEDAPVRLTFNRVADDHPHWSRDGKQILFSSNNYGNFDLYTMYRDGEMQRRITKSDADEIESDW